MQIIEAAADIFATKGYSATPLSEIMSVVGLTKPAFYFHFPSKEALALATFQYKLGRLMDEMEKGSAEPDRAIDRIAAALKARSKIFREDPGIRCILRIAAELPEQSKHRSQLRSLVTLPVDMIASLIEQAQSEGDVRSDIEPRPAARSLFAGMVGIDTLSDVLSGGADRDRRIDEFLSIVLYQLTSNEKLDPDNNH